MQGSGDGGLSNPVHGLGDDGFSSPVQMLDCGGPSDPIQRAGDDGLSSPAQRLDCGSPSDPAQGSVDYRGQRSRSIPTKGDGICFFRSVDIGLDGSFQSAQRDQTTGEIVDKLASLSETAQADNLRARAVAHMCQTGNIVQDESALSADMPPNPKLKTFIDRIEHMFNPVSIIGEQGVKATAKVVGRNIHVIIEGHSSRSNVMYRGFDGDDLPPILVKYTPHGDAGHYEALIPLRVNDISPLPQKERKKRVFGPPKQKYSPAVHIRNN